ncbi:hypothetical protein J6590_082315 [Homalodisca vitripennis]|nr:hypothetical protein J6590_082315 [Homalodisca vitripennis]
MTWNGGHKATGEGLPSVDGEVVVHTDTYTVQPPPLWNGGHKTTGEGLPSVDGEVVVHTDTYTVQPPPLWNGGHKTTGEGLPSVDGEVVVHTDTYTVQPRRRVELQAKVEDLKRITGYDVLYLLKMVGPGLQYDKRVFNEMVSHYFHIMLDVKVIHSSNHNFERRIIRRKFLEEIRLSLVRPFMQIRVQILILPRELRSSIKKFLPEEEIVAPRERPPARGRCNFCPRLQDRKTTFIFEECYKYVCKEHMKVVCDDCV